MAPAKDEPKAVVSKAGSTEVRLKIALAVMLSAAMVWAYLPTWEELLEVWEREPDYSHGYLVIPFALALLWIRRKSFPGVRNGIAWLGLSLLVASVGLRYAGARFALTPVDSWSLLLWTGGVVWTLFGGRALCWSLPSIAFLWFMTPLPFSAEHAVSGPLQRIATKISVWTLQTLGQPAIAEGNVILLNDLRLEIAQACSGLRIFMGIAAMATAYVFVVRRPWWEKGILVLCAVPIALLVNAARIVATGILGNAFPTEQARHLIHDGAGWLMVPLAALLFAACLFYLGLLFRPVERLTVKSFIKQGV